MCRTKTTRSFAQIERWETAIKHAKMLNCVDKSSHVSRIIHCCYFRCLSASLMLSAHRQTFLFKCCNQTHTHTRSFCSHILIDFSFYRQFFNGMHIAFHKQMNYESRNIRPSFTLVFIRCPFFLHWSSQRINFWKFPIVRKHIRKFKTIYLEYICWRFGGGVSPMKEKLKSEDFSWDCVQLFEWFS